MYSTKCPVTGTMTNGGVQTASVGMYLFDSGTVKGTVYSDANNNGIMDGGEKGIMDAYGTYLPPNCSEKEFVTGFDNAMDNLFQPTPPSPTPGKEEPPPSPIL